MAVKALRKTQLGKESTGGTAVAATAVWRGPANGIQDDREVTFVEEDVGFIGGVDRTHIAQLLASLSLESTPVTYQQIGYVLNAGVVGVAGVADGVGTDFIYTHAVATTAQKTPFFYTIETGDDQQAQEAEFAHVTSLTIEGNAGEAAMVSSDWQARQATNAAFTGALSLPAVEEVLVSKGKLYIDAIGGTIGTTQISNTLLNFTLNVATGFQHVFTADGSLLFSFVKQVAPEITLDLTFEHDTNAVAEFVTWRAETPQLLRLIFEGSVFGTPGTTYSNHTFIIDLAGKWETISALGEQDGNDTVTATFRARYNSTAAFFAEFIVANELTALP